MSAIMQASDQALNGRSADISSADLVFDALEETKIITEDGSLWLKLALDPFHDEQLVLDGQPSYDQADTIVQCIPKTFTVTAAGLDLAAGELWDANIFNLPIDTTCLENEFRPAISNGNGYRITTDATLTGSIGMITAAVAKSGDRTFPDGQPFTGKVVYRGVSPTDTVGTPAAIARQNNFCTGAHRIVGLGFEVVNPTQFLNLQGLVTAYRQDQQSYTTYGNEFDATGGVVGPFTDIAVTRGPPGDAQSAYQLRHSRQWLAREGSYTVCTQAGWDNPFQYPRQILPIFKGEDSQGVTDSNTTIPNSLALIARSGLGAGSSRGFANYSIHPFNTSGVYYTGLSRETVLQVNVRFFVERAPTLSEPDIQVLANPSPPYDFNAWKLYSEARGRMPVGVMLKENSLGDWFKRAAGTLIEDILPIGKAVATSILPALGPVGASVAHAISSNDELRASGARPRKSALLEPPERHPRRTRKLTSTNRRPPATKARGKR